jgi:hypothetical protein
MGNLSNKLESGKVRISLDSDKIEQGLYELINFDLDFTENEEYFREDTLLLGYSNEAERLAKEYATERKITNKKELSDCCEELLGMVLDSSYYGEWTLEVTESRKKNEFVVFYSYIS